MKYMLMGICCAVLFAAASVQAVEVTAERLTIDDVTPMLERYAAMKSGQLSKVYGVSRAKDSNVAKIFFQMMVKSRKGSAPKKGEINCFKLNSGKWFCGGVNDILTK